MTTERWNEINDILHNYDVEDFQNPKDPLSAMRLLTKYFDEIMNGGFYQYFSNMADGYDFHDHNLLVTALQTVGMKEYIKITKKAISLYKKCESDNENVAERAGEKIEELSEYFDDNSYINKLFTFADEHL
jgi:hypothetical protein